MLRAAPPFAKLWPDNLPLLDILCEEMGIGGNCIPESARNAIKRTNRPADRIAALRIFLTLSIMDGIVNQHLPWDKINPLLAKKPIEDLAKKLKVKLPPKWDEPLNQPVEDIEPPRRHTPKARR